VTEQGTHAELMARGGQYAELYTLQASQYVGVPASAEAAARG
jgi:ATP-binding cassette, subfamily B, bacterial